MTRTGIASVFRGYGRIGLTDLPSLPSPPGQRQLLRVYAPDLSAKRRRSIPVANARVAVLFKRRIRFADLVGRLASLPNHREVVRSNAPDFCAILGHSVRTAAARIAVLFEGGIRFANRFRFTTIPMRGGDCDGVR